ncbi:putative quinol monooxygenase [Hymenobacter metallicola]|uniref:Antibiotic biosynthesis monooxygenase n=1 Tax=Hymenobacter metallicola TaxID=2563114 RepID=A0A4Z0PYE7_9BACT|nr:hypothetical protein [Hymenobacter metallicola]TGE22747.1 hypothetical protein E5K02_23755 [Hymenobacter metallicola]
MSSNHHILRLTAVLRVAPADRPSFDQMYRELQAGAAAEGADKVLVYEHYFKDAASNECLLHEVFADEAAFTAHLALLAPIAAKYPLPLELVKYELCGQVSAETLAMLTAAYGEKFTHYGFQV